MPHFGDVLADLNEFVKDRGDPYRSTIIALGREYSVALEEIRQKFVALEELEQRINQLSETALVHKANFFTRWLHKRAWRRIFHRRVIKPVFDDGLLRLDDELLRLRGRQ